MKTNGCISLATIKLDDGTRAENSWWVNSVANPDNDIFVLTYEINVAKFKNKYTLLKFSIFNGVPDIIERKIIELSYENLDPVTWTKLYEKKVTAIERKMLGL